MSDLKQVFDPQEVGNDSSFVKWNGVIVAWLEGTGRSSEQVANTGGGIHNYVAHWPANDWTIDIFAVNPDAAIEALRRKEPHFAEAIHNNEAVLGRWQAALGRRQVVPIMLLTDKGDANRGVDVDALADRAERLGLVEPDMQGADEDTPEDRELTETEEKFMSVAREMGLVDFYQGIILEALGTADDDHLLTDADSEEAYNAVDNAISAEVDLLKKYLRNVQQ